MLACQKHRFSIAPGHHYLNCAYMGPLSQAVQEAGIAGIRRKADPTGIAAADFFTESDALRHAFAALLHASADRIAIIPSASYGIAVAARNLPVARAQRIVILDEQFPSNVYAWRRLAERSGGHVHTVARPDGAGVGEAWNDALLDAITGDTAIVAVPHVHWTDGTRFDLAQVTQRAHAVGARVVVDATQSLGALPFDVRDIPVDALVCAGYKWLLGPYSIGAAYFGAAFEAGEPLEESWIGRAGSEDFRGLVKYRDEYQPGAVRYDVGERSNFILVPMLLAALAQIHEWGVASIQDYCARLTRAPLQRAAELGYTVEADAWRGAHLFGLRMPPGTDLQRLDAELRRRGIFVSLRGSALRVSPNVYNDAADLDALLEALETAGGDRP